MVYMGSLTFFMIFIMAAGLAPNIGAQLTFRFLAGCFGSPPLVCAGGSINDIWDPLERTFGFPLFAISAFGGPVTGPVIGSYIGVGNLHDWRWTEWTTLVIAGLVLITLIAFQPETYPPLLLKWKAAHLRSVTGDDRYRADLEITKSTLWTRMRVDLTRPFTVVFKEPIIIMMALYLTIVYIVLFTFLGGYPPIFHDVYGTSQGLTNLLFLAMFAGVLLVTALIPPIYKRTKRQAVMNIVSGEQFPIHPEYRLWFAMCGAPAIPISLFWMGWTDYVRHLFFLFLHVSPFSNCRSPQPTSDRSQSSISIWSPLLASALFGYGIITIFITAYLYVIDSYERYAASALAFVSLTRYVAAGGMSVVGIPFYKNIGTHWTLTSLGCISAVLVPTPYVLYRYGWAIRKRSRLAISRS